MVTPCPAQDRNQQALHELELLWGAGRFDYGQLKRILTGQCEHQEAENRTMKITEFLEARIVENERAVAFAREYGVTKMFGSKQEPAIVIHEGGVQLWSTDQLLAECVVKRAIIEQVSDVAWGGYAVRDVVMEMLAAAYKDHPDYQQEWSPTNG